MDKCACFKYINTFPPELQGLLAHFVISVRYSAPGNKKLWISTKLPYRIDIAEMVIYTDIMIFRSERGDSL